MLHQNVVSSFRLENLLSTPFDAFLRKWQAPDCGEGGMADLSEQFLGADWLQEIVIAIERARLELQRVAGHHKHVGSDLPRLIGKLKPLPSGKLTSVITNSNDFHPSSAVASATVSTILTS